MAVVVGEKTDAEHLLYALLYNTTTVRRTVSIGTGDRKNKAISEVVIPFGLEPPRFRITIERIEE